MKHVVMAVIFFTVLAGCSQSERGELVFTRQNQAASALATVVFDTEARNSGTTKRLYDAETQLDDACRPLREAASLKMSGKPVGFESEVKIFISLDQCAAETKRIENLVRRIDPEVANFYLGLSPVSRTFPANEMGRDHAHFRQDQNQGVRDAEDG